MARAAAGMVLGGAAASVSLQPCLPPAKFSSSSDQFFSCRDKTKSALIPSCLLSAVPSCPSATATRLSYQATLLPSRLYSLSPPSWSLSSIAGSRVLKIVGLEVGLNGKFVQDLRRAAVGTSSRAAGTKVRSMAGQSEGALEDAIKTKNSENAVVLYSKSWCPYCGQVKSLFNKLGVSFKLVELDQLVDEQEVQEALEGLTGQSTVPSIFIGGKHIGGCDDTLALHQNGELIPALKAAGAKITGV